MREKTHTCTYCRASVTALAAVLAVFGTATAVQAPENENASSTEPAKAIAFMIVPEGEPNTSR